MRKFLKRLFALVVVVLLVKAAVVAWLIHYPASKTPVPEPVHAQAYLGQGWGDGAEAPLRQLYYYTPQGTTLQGLRYSWFAHLERPWGRARFAERDHMRAFGFIVDPAPTPANPDQLPVGFTKHFDRELNEDVLDLTCAACHTGEFHAVKDGKHVAVRVDGGPATHAFTSMKIGAFGPVLLGSMASTYLNPWKFDRFARGVLRERYKDGKGRLRADVGTVLWNLLKQAWIETSRDLYPVEEGFGRTDALGRISNAVFAAELDPANYRTGNAPVSYPYLWNIWKFDWVQYNASVNQPMARNMGESLGVGARIHLTDAYGRPLPPAERYYPATLVENLVRIEDALQRLEPPRWPEELLGKIDRAKAEQGRALFAQHCSHCHGVREMDEAAKAVAAPLRGPKDPLWQMTTLDLDEVGTDPTAALNFVQNRLDLRKSGLTADDLRALVGPLLELDRARRLKQIEGQIDAIRRRPPSTPADWQALAKAQADLEAAKKDTEKRNAEALAAIDPSSVPLGAALNYVGIISRQKYYDERGYSQARRDCMDGFGALDMPQIVAKYKARPLQGAWATAPFLHNGSVPNLYELLSPVTERSKRFFLGRRAYDPVKVGFVTEPEKGLEDSFWYDTRKPGNSNVGHEFRAGYVPWTQGATPQYGVIGPALSPDERFAIVEYLKIHEDPPTPPGRVPPDCSAATPRPSPPTTLAPAPAPTPPAAAQGDPR